MKFNLHETIQHTGLLMNPNKVYIVQFRHDGHVLHRFTCVPIEIGGTLSSLNSAFHTWVGRGAYTVKQCLYLAKQEFPDCQVVDWSEFIPSAPEKRYKITVRRKEVV